MDIFSFGDFVTETSSHVKDIEELFKKTGVDDILASFVNDAFQARIVIEEAEGSAHER